MQHDENAHLETTAGTTILQVPLVTITASDFVDETLNVAPKVEIRVEHSAELITKGVSVCYLA
jgi:hypothetical protein